MVPRLCWITLATRRASYGTVSPFTKHPNTAVGSIRLRSRSACSPANASLGAESPPWRNYSRKQRHGMPGSTTTGSKSTGNSLAKRPVRNSATSLPQQTASHGHRPSALPGAPVAIARYSAFRGSYALSRHASRYGARCEPSGRGCHRPPWDRRSAHASGLRAIAM
jgi:hypothetical protein